MIPSSYPHVLQHVRLKQESVSSRESRKPLMKQQNLRKYSKASRSRCLQSQSSSQRVRRERMWYSYHTLRTSDCYLTKWNTFLQGCAGAKKRGTRNTCMCLPISNVIIHVTRICGTLSTDITYHTYHHSPLASLHYQIDTRMFNAPQLEIITRRLMKIYCGRHMKARRDFSFRLGWRGLRIRSWVPYSCHFVSLRSSSHML